MTKQEEISGEKLEVGDMVVKGEDGKYYKARTKQEEIYWQIATLLVPVAQGKMDGFKASEKILSYLHSQGVVIKVDRELPEIKPFIRNEWTAHDTQDECYQNGQAYMLMRLKEAGYVAVEPLIKE